MARASSGASTLIAWKRRSSDRSFSMYFRYSAGVVAPMHRISPRDSAGFRMLAASSDPSADPAPTSVCSSSMNTMMLGVLDQLLHDRLQPLLELPPVLRPGDHERDVQRDDPLVGEVPGHAAGHDPLGEPFDNRGLADAGLADEHRVVLRPPAQHLLDALDLLFAADQRVERLPARRRR